MDFARGMEGEAVAWVICDDWELEEDTGDYRGESIKESFRE